MSEAIISVTNLGKKYCLKHRAEQQRYTALRDVLANKVKGLFRPRKPEARNGKSEEDFWALQEVSFEIKRGEVVGIIGRNGSGKSTLLKVLSRITEQTTGRVHLKGRVASLLEVGTGFHPELTGRENVFLNGAILGMGRAEIRQKFDEIVEFAEVEKFLDTPVKRYSSGMYVRLAFAVAAHLEPEILVVDEVLAVGDTAFQKKCLGKIKNVSMRDGRTVLFVSHNMGVVANLCQNVLWLKDGRIHNRGAAKSIVQSYLANNTAPSALALNLDGITREAGYGERVRLVTLEWLAGYPLCHGQSVKLRMICATTSKCEDVSVGVGFSSLEGIRLLTYDSDLVNGVRFTLDANQKVAFDVEIPNLPVSPGTYLLDVGIRSGDMHGMDYIPGAAQIEVIAGNMTPSFIIRQDVGVRLSSFCTMRTHDC